MSIKHDSPALRGLYMQRFFGRCLVLLAGVLLYCVSPSSFDVLEGTAFFRQFSLLHLLWLVWVGDMLLQLVPSRRVMALGSLKYMSCYHRPTAQSALSHEEKRTMRRGAAAIFVIWGLLIAALGLLHRTAVLNDAHLLLICIFFYVCDLICVLFWCPFRVFFMKNRCCTTCRIFNWDHLMMFTPMLFVPGFYGWSLLSLSIVVWVIWEITLFRHPERFSDRTNQALRCAECTDLLCGKRKK